MYVWKSVCLQTLAVCVCFFMHRKIFMICILIWYVCLDVCLCTEIGSVCLLSVCQTKKTSSVVGIGHAKAEHRVSTACCEALLRCRRTHPPRSESRDPYATHTRLIYSRSNLSRLDDEHRLSQPPRTTIGFSESFSFCFRSVLKDKVFLYLLLCECLVRLGPENARKEHPKSESQRKKPFPFLRARNSSFTPPSQQRQTPTNTTDKRNKQLLSTT